MLQGLNEEQSKAAQEINGPVIVFAGAGSGKTRTLTSRIMHMICDESINPYSILAITYTNKATNEMKERLGEFGYGVTISTIHSLCCYILRREISYLGYDSGFNICDEDDQLKVINEVLKDKNQQKGVARDLQKTFKFCKCSMTRPNSSFYCECFDKYNDKLKELNMLDFDDLLIKTLELFENNEEVLEKYQNKYKYILIDEFQDTNLIQYNIFKLLADKHRNLFIVGDDDQSIYSFRGTNYENFNNFKRDFPEYKQFTLNVNYRSTSTIIEYASRLIANNKNRQTKDIKTITAGSKNDVVIHTSKDQDDEAIYVTRMIENLKQNCNYSDIAVLYRNSVLMRNVELELIRLGLPYKVYGGQSYLSRREVKDILAYFKLMLNNNDMLSFIRVVNVPSRSIGSATIEKIEKAKKEYKLSLFDTIDLMKTLIPQSKYNELVEFKNLIKNYGNRLKEEDLVKVFNDLLKEIGYKDYLIDEYGSDEARDRFDNVKDFASILYKVENNNLDKDKIDKLKEAIDDAILSESHSKYYDNSKDAITLSTIHSVKGLEFSYVFVIGLEEDVFPKVSKFDPNENIEEERRIAYVAMTRAKKLLYLSHATSRLLYGTRYYNKVSRFITESAGIDFSENVKPKQTIIYDKPKPAMINDTKDSCGYEVSDKIYHKVFGEGIILGIENGIGNVFFASSKSTKKLLLCHPAISKIEK